MGWRLDPIFWFTVRLGWPWQKIIIFQWIDAVLAKKASWISHLQKENLSLKLTARQRAARKPSCFLPTLGSKLGAFLNWRVLPLQPNHQGVLGFRPKFLPRFASGTSTTRCPPNRIFDSESSLLRDFFTQKSRGLWGRSKSWEVILSDFEWFYFSIFLGDFKVNGCRENFSGGNKECFTNGEVECQCGGSLFFLAKPCSLGPGGALKSAEISGGTLLALSTENGGSGKLYCSETSNWIATLQGAYWKGKQHSCKSFLKWSHAYREATCNTFSFHLCRVVKTNPFFLCVKRWVCLEFLLHKEHAVFFFQNCAALDRWNFRGV